MDARRFGRAVAKSADEHSTLLKWVPKVQLLYGRTWRMQDHAGKITPASSLTKHEFSMELPRLEYITPEAMRQRRLLAIRRIAELDRNAAEELV